MFWNFVITANLPLVNLQVVKNLLHKKKKSILSADNYQYKTKLGSATKFHIELIESSRFFEENSSNCLKLISLKIFRFYGSSNLSSNIKYQRRNAFKNATGKFR